MIDWCKKYELTTVPMIEENFILRDKDVKFMVEYADGQSKLNPEVLREGIVIRSMTNPKMLSFKAISNKFLLKHDI